MKVGFTGTREGMTREQIIAMNEWLEFRDVSHFHHGACVGADADAVECVQNFAMAWVYAHPPEDDSLLSHESIDSSDFLEEPRPYLQRNHDIVDASELLLACPKGPEEQRSGTWATIRYARRVGKPVVIFWPDGKVSE